MSHLCRISAIRGRTPKSSSSLPRLYRALSSDQWAVSTAELFLRFLARHWVAVSLLYYYVNIKQEERDRDPIMYNKAPSHLFSTIGLLQGGHITIQTELALDGVLTIPAAKDLGVQRQAQVASGTGRPT